MVLTIYLKKICKVFILPALIIIFSLLFSCTGNDLQNKELIYWSANNPDEIEFAKIVVEEWNDLNPDIQVRFQPVPEGRSSEEIILAAVVGKTTPDIYSNMWQGDVENYAQAGVLIPLDTIPGFLDNLKLRCETDVIEEVTSTDGHIYQVPWKINPIMMIYNKKIFNNLGLEKPPATYLEYLEAAKHFQKDADGDGYVDHWIGYSEILVTWWQRFFDFYPLYLAASGGAKLVDNNKVVFNNKYAVETFAFLQKLYNQNYFARELLSARQDVFLSGVIATRFTGPWDIVHTEKFKPNGFEYSFAPLPAPDSSGHQRYTYGDPKNIVIFNTCKHPENAWKFLSFLINRKNDLLLLTTTTQLPRRKKLFEDKEFNDYFNNNPKIIPFAEQAQYVRGTDPCPVLKEIFDIISMEYEACVVYGIKTPEQAVKDAAKTAQLLLD